MAVQAAAIVADGRTSRPDVIAVSLRAEPFPPGAQHDITLDQIRTYVQDETAMLMDVRSPEDFARGHVRRAVNLPAGSEKQMDGYLALIRPSIASDQLIILYCYGPKCGSADMVSEYLTDQGFTDLHVYSPGWPTLASAEDLQ
jgi:rhodanese-related sulfurtransferase